MKRLKVMIISYLLRKSDKQKNNNHDSPYHQQMPQMMQLFIHSYDSESLHNIIQENPTSYPSSSELLLYERFILSENKSVSAMRMKQLFSIDDLGKKW